MNQIYPFVICIFISFISGYNFYKTKAEKEKKKMIKAFDIINMNVESSVDIYLDLYQEGFTDKEINNYLKLFKRWNKKVL